MNMTTLSRERTTGMIFVALSAVAFGAMAIFGKLVLAAGLGLSSLLALRFVLAGGVMALTMLVTRTRWPRGRSLLILGGMGGIGYVSQAFCYFSALNHASAGLTALLLYLFPAIVTVLSAVIQRRWPSPLRVVAVALAFAGTVLTVGGDASGSPLGMVLGIAAALIYSVYILVGEGVTAREGAMASSTVVMLSAAVSSTAVATVQGFVWPIDIQAWAAVLGIALICTVGAINLFFAGLRRLGAPDTSALSTLEPLTTIALAAVFLGESIAALQIFGGLVILGAVILIARSRD